MKDKAKKQFIKELEDIGIIAAIGDAISIQDTNFKILFQNQRHKDIIGDQVGEYCYKAVHGRDHVCEGCHLVMSFKDGKIHTKEQCRTTDKGIMYVEITASPLRDSTGKIIAGIEVVRNITKRKRMEKALQRAHDRLEIGVKERTVELRKANEELLAEIDERKMMEKKLYEAEKKLRIRAKELEESNIALKVLLKQRENDKRELEENILSNMKHLILPYIEKLKKNRSMSEELAYLNILESNLKEIISPFSDKLSSKYLSFTPREILVADLIKDGKQDKDITEILNISLETVKSHRQNIRKKLGIYSKRINLRTYLLSLAK